MKNIVAFLLLFAAGLSLSAQGRGVSIFVLDVTGQGSAPTDNLFITTLLTNDVRSRNFNVPSFPYGSNYLLVGTLFPYVHQEEKAPQTEARSTETVWIGEEAWVYENQWYGDEDVPNPQLIEPYYYVQMYVLHLELKDTLSDAVLIEYDLMYYSQNDLTCLFPLLMEKIFSYPIDNSGDWRDRMLYFGANLYWSPRVYLGSSQETHFMNFGIGIALEFHFLTFMSFEAGMELTPDWVVVSNEPGDSFRDLTLEFPVSLKFVLKPAAYFMIEPYGGVHINLPLYSIVNAPLLSWMTGVQLGVKAGPGVFYIDPRFSMDIGSSVLDTADAPDYTRYMLHIALGYKLGVIPRKR